MQRCGTVACAVWVTWKAAAVQACGPHPGCISYPSLKQPLERPTLSLQVKRTHSLPAGSADLRTWLQLPDWLTGRVKHCRGVCRPRSERHRVASICVSMEAFPAHRTQVNKSQGFCSVHFLFQNLNSSKEGITLTLALRYIKGVETIRKMRILIVLDLRHL